MVSDGTNFSEFVPSKADGVVDYNNPNNVIKLGWSGDSFTAADFTYALGLSDDKKIKDVSKTEYKKWLGLNAVDNTADANKSVNYANSSNYANYCNNERSVVISSTRPTDDKCKIWVKI